MNKDILIKEERNFILNLNKRVNQRNSSFTKKDKVDAIKILKKLNREIILKELDLSKG